MTQPKGTTNHPDKKKYMARGEHIKQIPGATVRDLADKSATRHMESMDQITTLREEMNERFDNVDSSIQTLTSDIDAGFGRLEEKIDDLGDRMETALNTQTALLKQLVENTKPR